MYVVNHKMYVKQASDLIDMRDKQSQCILDKRTNILDKITKSNDNLLTVIQPPGVTTYNEEQDYNSAYPSIQVPYGNSGNWIGQY